MQIRIYTVGTTYKIKNGFDFLPNDIVKVPYRINSETIFFGPCSILLREEFFKKYKNKLFEETPKGEYKVKEQIYLVGVNAVRRNVHAFRKIIWIGKIRVLYTFEKAFNIFSKKKEFSKMMDEEESPMHLEPLYNSNQIFVGYKHRNKFHNYFGKTRNGRFPKWVLDITRYPYHSKINIDYVGKKVSIKNKYFEERKDLFSRDCCFNCDNLFFAEGTGLKINDDLLRIFKIAQKNDPSIDNYNIFGKDIKDNPKGRRGVPLRISDDLGNEFMKIVIEELKKVN